MASSLIAAIPGPMSIMPSAPFGPGLASWKRSRNSRPLRVHLCRPVSGSLPGSLSSVTLLAEQAVVGETPNVAARLQGLAEPGAVVTAASTRSLTGGLVDRDLGTVSL